MIPAESLEACENISEDDVDPALSHLLCGTNIFPFNLHSHSDRTVMIRLERASVDVIWDMGNKRLMVFW
jgi:hypothetical protein